MSRHTLQPREHWGATVAEVVIGWDRPLNTFFVQVIGNRGGTKVWKGTRLNELPTSSSAITVASDYAAIPDGLKTALDADKAASAGEQDSTLQASLKSAGIIR